ncbi:DNA-binding protein [Pseudomonas capsici]|uniref:Harpin HrpZ family protein n=1 Tax=Pseudomonas capsici TaxID=2810614 RepID=A0ABT3C032_9PSED|nr:MULTISPECIES: DNA-binding protein [Pseudomonas]MBN6716095.1 DNA-binding protein [Pseudomonas capsici]MBN6721024.1 DNA-binding protein [Pseudomonas capsici]MBN6726145.1 DNA-binding protein [Pseudomonas capsici]MBX8477145.1 harpin HrpZ family protein [Pseudomonas cichorii]MCV4269358.1 harpin HrpZ family protein [Pseudomonas capsici]
MIPSSSIGAAQGTTFQSTFASTQMSAMQSDSNGSAGKIASLLGDTMFEKSGSGANIRDTDNPLLGMVADYMDRNPDQFGKPHDANGKVNGWRDELSEDKYLNSSEKESFTKGLEGLINEFLSGGSKGQNVSGGSGFGTGNSGFNAGNNTAPRSSSGCGGSPAASNGASGGGLQELLAALLGSLGEEKLDNLLTPNTAPNAKSGQMSFNFEDKDVLKEISRFMDMHPEEFGKPDGKSKDWMGELSEGDNVMSKAESEQFQKAINMIKGEIKDSAQGNSLGGLFPNAEQNFQNGGAGNTLKTDASIAAGNVLSVLVQQSVTDYRG